MSVLRIVRTLFVAGLLAYAIQASSDPIVNGGPGHFVPTLMPATPSATGGAKPGLSGMAKAAAAAGFKAIQPGMPVIDMGAFRPSNPLPPGVAYVSFRTLASFPYEGDCYPWNDPFSEPKRNPHPKRKVPKSILALNGKRVACMGFMLPWDFKPEGTRHFGLLRNQVGCCFGTAPALNEWIDVTVKDKPADVWMDTPLLLVGTLKVKRITESGNTMGLYSMTAESVERTQIQP